MEFKGTKGNWQLEINESYPEVQIKQENKSVNFSIFLNRREEGIDDFRYNDDSLCQESKSNALLISKAPEMLELLNEFREFLNKVQSPATPALFLSQSIRNLIKKATEL